MNTIENARGRWLEILPRLGISPAFLVDRHGPCPICGGKDRFRFDNRDGTGSYFCNQCGAGSGVILLRKLHGWDHRTACDEIDKIIGTAGDPAPIATPKTGTDASQLAAIERLLADATRADIVSNYLAKRGLSSVSAILKGHAALPYFLDKKLVGRFPAIVVPIHSPTGALVTAHRIYDAEISPRKKLMPIAGTIRGAAARLHAPVSGELGIAEGVETALAAFQLFGVPTWAGITANGLESFEPPSGLRKIHIFGDNDLNAVGQAAAYALAKRASCDGLSAEVHLPPDADTDWNDMVRP